MPPPREDHLTSYGPAERALFESECTALYDAAVASDGLAPDDPRLSGGTVSRRAFDLLVDVGLLHFDRARERWVPEDPAAVQSRIVSPLSHEGTRLLEESTQWARIFGGLSQTWRRAPQATSRGPFTYLHDVSIDPYIAGLVAEAETEILTAQPQANRDARKLQAAADRDAQALERGVTLRTLYQHSARRSTATRDYVATVTERGAEVRTLDEFFNRMIVVDRRVVVLPSAEGVASAMAVREPSLVAYLVDIFERTWERARPFTSRESSVMKDIAAEQRAMTMRMLIEGHSDPVSAKRLGVSPRTYAGYVADLKEEFEAETRFQLGYVLGRLGVTGADDPGGPASNKGSDA